jgi:hypothetical protein
MLPATNALNAPPVKGSPLAATADQSEKGEALENRGVMKKLSGEQEEAALEPGLAVLGGSGRENYLDNPTGYN